MIPTDQPSGSTQMVRISLPSTLMAPDIAAIHRKARHSPQWERGDREASGRAHAGRLRNGIQQPRPRARASRNLRALDARGGGLPGRSDEGTARRARIELRIVAASIHRPFSPRRGMTAPLALFIHGGYWRSLDPSLFSHMARGLNAHGVAVGVVGYDLCPELTIADIIDQIRHACLFLWLRTGERTLIYGHSAGGHLAAAMVATDWQSLYPKAPADLVPAAYSISGLFDLIPLVGIPMAQDLRLDEAEARRVSTAVLAGTEKAACSMRSRGRLNRASSCARAARSPTAGARLARRPATRRPPG